MRSLDVGVIGSGTAGSAAAIFLARAGHRITLYERVPEPKPVGAGITLQPTGLHVLERLGLDEHVVTRGARIDRLVCESIDPRKRARSPLIDLTYETVGEGLFGLGVHRGVLFEALLCAAERESRVDIRRGVEIVDLAPAEHYADRSRWSWLVDVARARHGPHELVVIADGARSQLRDDTSTSKRIERYPWGALWFVGRQPKPPDHPLARTLHQVAAGNRSFVGLLPTGVAPASDEPARAQQLVSLFWSLRADRLAAWRERGLDGWKADVLHLEKEAEPVLEQIDDPSQVLFASYYDVVMSRWHTRNAVYLGDAAHATSPQLGQGCNLALWDAMELANCLNDETKDLARALDRYSRRREEHLAFYQFATRWLTPFFQGDVETLGVLRDHAMPLIAKLPPVKRLMTLTMLGVVDGFSGRMLPLSGARRH